MALAVLQAAQQLAILSPSFDTPIQPGQSVTVSWKSPYQFTNVEVLQGPDSTGAYQVDTLAANATQDLNTVMWTAESAPGYNFSLPFQFRVQKGDLPNDCALCTTSTSQFLVANANNAPAASSPEASSAQSTDLMASATTPIAAATSASDAMSSQATENSMTMASSSEQASSATSASDMMTMASSTTDAATGAATTSASETMSMSMASSLAAAATSSAAAMSSPASSAAPSSSSAAPTAAGASPGATSTSMFQQITEQNYSPPMKETLALGLGIGIPLGLLAIGMIVFLLWDKKRKQKKYASSAMGYDEQRRRKDLDIMEEVAKGYVASRESQTTRHSHKTVSSYHSQFDFEDGSARESWLDEAVRAGRDTWA